jgi:hypothetical protein
VAGRGSVAEKGQILRTGIPVCETVRLEMRPMD